MNNYIFLIVMLFLSCDAIALSLSDAYNKALDFDARYASSQDLLNATRAQSEQAKAQLKPSVFLSVTKRNEAYSLPTSISGSYDENSLSQYLSLTQPIYNRKLFYGIDIAKSQLDLAELQKLHSLQDLALRVSDAYLSIILYQEYLSLDQLQLQTTESRLEQVLAAMAVGYASTVDVYNLKAELDDIVSRKVLHEQQLTIARQQLSLLIGEQSPSFLALPHFIPHKLLAEFAPNKFQFDAAIDQNLIVKSRAALVDIAEADLEIRRSEQYPSLNLGVFYSNTQSSNYFAQKNDNRVIYLEMTFPIYQGGYAESRLREGKARLKSNQNEELSARREAIKKIQTQLSTLTSSAERLKAIDKSIESGIIYLESVEEGFRLGLRDINEVSRAKEKLFNSRRDKISTTIGFMRSLIQLYAETAMLDDAFIRHLDKVVWSRLP